MSTSSQSKWFLDDNILEEPNAFFWCTLNEQADLSVDNNCSLPHINGPGKPKSKKRSCNELDGGVSRKACREKMRRDRLNDRFLELSTVLEPGRTPKTDKALILSDALDALKQLKCETLRLSVSNEEVRESIRKLKTEKNELRDEKQRLKAEKERLDQEVKLMMMHTEYLPHPAAVRAAMAAFAQSQAVSGKGVSVPVYPAIGMWQWIPPAALDTSQDHKLRPPVA